MNDNQIQSLIRTALKVIGALLISKGYTAAGGTIENMVNMPDVLGLLTLGAGVAWSHLFHYEAGNPPGNITKGATQLLCIALPLLAINLTGCAGIQFTETASGSGAKMGAAIPSPFGGGQIVGMNLIVGSWKSSTIVQPTNSVISVAQVTRGQQNISGAATNGSAGILAGEFDATVISTGAGSAAITNVGNLNLK